MDPISKVTTQLVEEINLFTDKRKLSNKQSLDLYSSVRELVQRSIMANLFDSNGLASIHLRSQRYSRTRYYRGPGFNIFVGRAFRSLESLGYLKIPDGKKGLYTDTARFLTRFCGTEKLFALFANQTLCSLPIYFVPLDSSEPIVVQKYERLSDGFWDVPLKKKVEYTDTRFSNAARKNLDRINGALSKHWFDLEIDDAEMRNLNQEIAGKNKSNSSHIDLSRRRLTRIFANRQLTEGGRFYGGWWQNIPKRYRSKIIINGKRTVEVDFSGLHPTILYALRGVAVDRDPYDIGLPNVPREVVKIAFNAMLNAHKTLRNWPQSLQSKSVSITWTELSDRILDANAEIESAFYSGFGLRLQFEDSELAERVMLRFVDELHGVPILPIHDSFIVHSGYETALKDVMVSVFKERYGVDISLKARVFDTPENLRDMPTTKDLRELLSYANIGHELRLEAFRNF